MSKEHKQKKIYHARTQAMMNHYDVSKMRNSHRALPSQHGKVNRLENKPEETSDQEPDETPQGDIPEDDT